MVFPVNLVQRHSLFLGFVVGAMGKQQLARVVPRAVTGKQVCPCHPKNKTRASSIVV